MFGFLGLSNLLIVAIVSIVVGAITWSRLWGRNAIGRVTWTDAWLKAGIVTVAAVMLVAYLPARVLQTGTVANMSRTVQDLIGTSVWAGGLLAVLIGLHHLRRSQRV